MHFYEFNIGEYAKKTQHLTNEEDLAYRRLLDMYYDTEKPIPIPSVSGGLATLSRRLRVSEQALQNVLIEFFPDGINKHAEELIAAYYAYIDKQKANGKLGGRPKRTQAKPTANPVLTQVEPSAKPPLTTNQLPLTTNKEKTKKQRVKNEGITLAVFVENQLAKYGRRIPPDHHVYAYIKTIGLPTGWIVLAWHAFCKKQAPEKMQKDWLKTFQNYVENPDWLGVWKISDDGSYYLTSAGKPDREGVKCKWMTNSCLSPTAAKQSSASSEHY